MTTTTTTKKTKTITKPDFVKQLGLLRDRELNTIFHFCAETDDVILCKLFYPCIRMMQHRNTRQQTPLHIACKLGAQHMVTYFLCRPCSMISWLLACDIEGRTCLHHAISGGFISISRSLVDYFLIKDKDKRIQIPQPQPAKIKEIMMDQPPSQFSDITIEKEEPLSDNDDDQQQSFVEPPYGGSIGISDRDHTRLYGSSQFHELLKIKDDYGQTVYDVAKITITCTKGQETKTVPTQQQQELLDLLHTFQS